MISCDNNNLGVDTERVVERGRLGDRDVVDQEADAALGDDVRHAVAQLDGDDGAGALEPQHGEEVDHG
eukprot:scaffold16799_cov73-Phaeocystis_antarctica.AAC.5